MSEFTRAQLHRLIEHAKDVIRRSQELRRELDLVIARIKDSGTVEKPVDPKVVDKGTRRRP